jgi:hypothetical protein
MEDNEEDEVQILKQPPIPIVDLVSESEKDNKEVEILEPPPIPVVDVDPYYEEETTHWQDEVVSMDTSEDTEGEIEMLEEFDKLDLSWEESQVLARAKGKRVQYRGKV